MRNDEIFSRYSLGKPILAISGRENSKFRNWKRARVGEMEKI